MTIFMMKSNQMANDRKILNFPNKELLHEQAAAWIARMDEDTMNAEDIAELKQWVNQSEAHKKILLHSARVWDRMDVMAGLSELLSLDDIPAKRKPLAVPVMAAIAASLFCLGILVYYYYGGDLQPEFQQSPVAVERQAPVFHETVVGETDVVSLDDGSIVKLNTATRIQVDISETRRNVTLLEGEAYFEVARNEDTPFVVNAGKTVIQALGTAFSVYKLADQIEVTVTEGLVQVKHDSEAGQISSEWRLEPVLLRAGQLLQVNRPGGQEIQEIETAEVARRLLWQQKMLAFDGNTLQQVIDEFSRYTSFNLIISDAETASIRVGGYFRSDDIAGLLTSLEENFAISVKQVATNTFELQKNQR